MLNKLRKKLRRDMGRAISDFNMIEANDHIMCCVSGGKDSYSLLEILLNLQQNAPLHFTITAVNLDQKQPGFPEHILPEYLTKKGVPYHIIEKDTYSIVKAKIPAGKTTCSLCSRLRRGILYHTADQIGATKIALGHHRDDILETLLLNMFHGGTLKAMPPKLLSQDQKHIVIRPLAYAREKDLIRYAQLMQFPIIPCNLCGTQTNLQRQSLKTMLKTWEQQFPGRVDNMSRALQHVIPSHLADTQFFDFQSLKTVDHDVPVDPPLDTLSPVSEQINKSVDPVQADVDIIRILSS
ncbi:MAG: tRNA 2-thiocytidine(32) synthetase TtcA [Endozoicomonadaceae bacterium]|nr:tRNA 2-thiocytidine(32) synthetase TtcA [Endozoicomonadaceae bacterium]